MKRDGAMKITLLVTLLFGLVFLTTVGAAERTLTPQQQRMTSCNQQATAQGVEFYSNAICFTKVALFLFVGGLTEGVPGSRDAVEMRLQRAIGFVRIMTADRVNDRNMLLIANVVMLMQSLISHGWTCGD